MGSDEAAKRCDSKWPVVGAELSASWLVNVVGHGTIVSIFLVLALLMFSVVAMHIPPINLEKLEELRPGMSAEEVTAVLGEPTHIESDQWIYAGWGWPMVHVHFAADGHYESSEYDY